ncbi:MAG: bifunctional riboflavin kinase/FAD synthetase [Gammaproteobacteria bacterium]|jgi:riboflavin kinase/FMN adenylyltransferase|nr:bifunctional riboflavin kinase/FAD synthetase [Gammaproteobacteria bacterium]
MSIFSEFSSFKAEYDACVATIGKYDGLHLGHQHVVESLRAIAKARNLPSVVILSEPHPEEYFAGDKAPPRLSRFQDKVDFLLSNGVDAIYKMTFDKALCELSALDFIQQFLVDGLHVSTLIVGDDFRFGHKRSGDFSLLQEKGLELGFEVLREEPCLVEGERVSSTLVRQALMQGDFEAVRNYLGRNYVITGKVEEGKKLGRELGIPTANLMLGSSKLPLHGIFSVKVQHEDRTLLGVASVGYNPTVENIDIPKLEVFLFDFDEDIYGETLHVEFVQKLRDEKTFDNLDALKTQMEKDIEEARLSLQVP